VNHASPAGEASELVTDHTQNHKFSVHAPLEVPRGDTLRCEHVHDAAPAGKAVAVDARQEALGERLEKVIGLKKHETMRVRYRQYTHTHMYTLTHTHTHTHTYIYIYIYIYICKYIYICIYIYMCIYTSVAVDARQEALGERLKEVVGLKKGNNSFKVSISP